MKSVFVVGFSPAVKQVLESSFQRHFENCSLSWVAEGRGVTADVDKFKQLFFSRLSSCNPTEALVLFAVPPESKWLDAQLERLVGEARSRYTRLPIGLDIYRDFGAANQVKARIVAFDMPAPAVLSIELVRERLKGGKVICVVAAGRPTILQALRRAGLPAEAIEEFFDEEIVETGSNSMLMQRLEKHIKNYQHMLYAWETLRTSSRGLTQGFRRKGQYFEAGSSGKVVELFRRFLSSGMN